MSEFSGKAAIVTGASRGIGKGACLRMAEMGFDIFSIARNSNELTLLKSDVEAKGVKCVTFVADVSDFDALGEAMKSAYDAFGRTDVLVNSAGTGVMCPFEDLTRQDIDTTVDVNLKGTIYATKQILPYMAKSGGGNIINISSMSAIRGIPDPVNSNGIYTATKFAINGFSECMQKYLLKYKIRVTTLCPGSTATSWWDRWTHSFGTDVMVPVSYVQDIIELILNSPENILLKQLQVLPNAEVNNF